MVTEKEVDTALHYLMDHADAAAKARAERLYMEEYRKSLKAMLMKEHLDLPVNAQERNAYADERYLEHLDALRTAIHGDEKNRFLLAANEAVIEVWRTLQANERGKL